MGDPMVWLFLAVAVSWVRNVMQDRRIERLERDVEDVHEFAGRAYRLAAVPYEDADGVAEVPRDIVVEQPPTCISPDSAILKDTAAVLNDVAKAAGRQ